MMGRSSISHTRNFWAEEFRPAHRHEVAGRCDPRGGPLGWFGAGPVPGDEPVGFGGGGVVKFFNERWAAEGFSVGDELVLRVGFVVHGRDDLSPC